MFDYWFCFFFFFSRQKKIWYKWEAWWDLFAGFVAGFYSLLEGDDGNLLAVGKISLSMDYSISFMHKFS
jgi:hypothetical protein